MPKFQKRPVVIEARRWDGTVSGASDVIDWILANGGTATFYCADGEECRAERHDLAIDTLDGRMFASVGDWIVRGVQGGFYPFKPDIFASTYEPVSA